MTYFSIRADNGHSGFVRRQTDFATLCYLDLSSIVRRSIVFTLAFCASCAFILSRRSELSEHLSWAVFFGFQTTHFTVIY